MLTLESVAHFSWTFGHEFFLETITEGNWIWSDPSYPGGNHTIKKFKGNYKQFCKLANVPYCRNKGTHVIGDYCGMNVKILEDK